MATVAALSHHPTSIPEPTEMAKNMHQQQESFSLRLASTSDVEAIKKLGTKVFTTTFGHSVSTEELAAYLDSAYSYSAIEADIQNSNKDLVVATTTKKALDGTSKERLLGFAQLTRNSREQCIDHLANTVELQRIYVDNAAHGMGVGKSLSNRLDEMAREQGFQYIWLGVWEENVKAQKVYARLGYETIGEHEFAVGSVVQRDLIMTKKL